MDANRTPTPTPTPTPNPGPGRLGGSVADRYAEPGWFTRRMFNPVVVHLTRRGVSVWGSRLLEVPGRRSGEIRSTPVNVVTLGDRRYLVAPRGTTQWVRNVRAADSFVLRVGHRVERVEAVEVPDDAKPEVLRAYLRRWKWEVGRFFDGLGPDAADDELRAAGPRHPVFEIRP